MCRKRQSHLLAQPNRCVSPSERLEDNNVCVVFSAAPPSSDSTALSDHDLHDRDGGHAGIHLQPLFSVRTSN